MAEIKTSEKSYGFAVKDENGVVLFDTIRDRESDAQLAFTQRYKFCDRTENWNFWSGRGAVSIEIIIKEVE